MSEIDLTFGDIEAAVAPGGIAELALDQLDDPGSVGGHGNLEAVLDVPVELTVEIGRTTMTIGETLAIGPGSIVSLNRAIGEPVDLLVNGKRIARGEVVAIDEEFGLRLTDVVSAARRLSEAQAAAVPDAPEAPVPVVEPVVPDAVEFDTAIEEAAAAAVEE